MRIFFDTEFIEDGKTIELISIGLVREDGHFYYAEVAEAHLSRANDWVRDNVLVHLQGGEHRRGRRQIAMDIITFVGANPQFWAYYADYDWVVLCQLYGTMMDLPSSWPKHCMDIKQWADMMGNPQLPTQLGTEHHALADARWVRQAWAFLRGLDHYYVT